MGLCVTDELSRTSLSLSEASKLGKLANPKTEAHLETPKNHHFRVYKT
jgi:hypothetical protein